MRIIVSNSVFLSCVRFVSDQWVVRLLRPKAPSSNILWALSIFKGIRKERKHILSDPLSRNKYFYHILLIRKKVWREWTRAVHLSFLFLLIWVTLPLTHFCGFPSRSCFPCIWFNITDQCCLFREGGEKTPREESCVIETFIFASLLNSCIWSMSGTTEWSDDWWTLAERERSPCRVSPISTHFFATFVSERRKNCVWCPIRV